MKLQCQVEIVNRLQSSLNFRSNYKYSKSTLALGKGPQKEINDFFILHFSSTNKSGTKYKIKCIKQVFVKFLNEGKVTLRFEEPPVDICIKAEILQLKCFMNLLKSCLVGDTNRVDNISNIGSTCKDIAPRKLVINNRNEIPLKGLPRTLERLQMSNLKLCNFRRDILALHNLTVLDLSNNEIENIPVEFGKMCNIQELYLNNNSLGTHYDWRFLSGPQITNVLKLLDLSGNNIKFLPKAIWRLHKLVTLKLRDNLLQHLPSTIGRIKTLRYLNICNNNLRSLPYNLLHCPLDYIDISQNSFSHLVDESEEVCSSSCDTSVKNLVNLAAKVVLKFKIYYSPKVIPWTLVQFLDDANTCLCGQPVSDETFYNYKYLELKHHFSTVEFQEGSSSLVKMKCYYCSFRCFNKK